MQVARAQRIIRLKPQLAMKADLNEPNRSAQITATTAKHINIR